MPQSLSNLLTHIVFSTKNRERLIHPSIELELYAFLVSSAANLGNFVHKIGGDEDHIHILLSLNKTCSISQIVEELKKTSSRWIKTKSSQFSFFSWQKGYGAFSISSTHLNVVMEYIANQKEHHRTVSFQDEYLRLLQKNGVIFDINYLWN